MESQDDSHGFEDQVRRQRDKEQSIAILNMVEYDENESQVSPE